MRKRSFNSTWIPICRAARLPLALCVAGCFFGCGAHDAGPETYPVSGTLTYQGKPVAGAYVAFHALKSGVSASAVTDDTGAFVASTHFNSGRDQKEGMVPGEYRITVIKQDVASIKSTLSPPKNFLPQRFATPESSPLTAVVSTTSENSYDLTLN